MNLLLLQLRNFLVKPSALIGRYIDTTCFPEVFSESPLNTDTRIIRTLWHVPSVSVLTGFHCIGLSTDLIPGKTCWLDIFYSENVTPSVTVIFLN